MNSRPNDLSWWPSDEEKGVLRASFVRFIPRSADAVHQFYGDLFERQPAARGLFPTEMDEMEEKMVAMLAFLIDRLDTPESFQEECRDLGKRHRKYGATEEHYPVVGSSLIGALIRGEHPILSPVEAELWKNLYGLISTFMLSGARESAETPPPK
jgi:hemoglobin-like flavoprotein